MGIKTFSATLQRDREALGDVVTEWIRRQRVRVTEVRVFQSSDSEYHCLSMVVFYEEASGERGREHKTR